MSYVTKCRELAEYYFNEDEDPPLDEVEVNELARLIQTTIEDYLSGRQRNLHKENPPHEPSS